jgi:hypothetical protein
MRLSLSLRLALMFAVLSLVTASAIGFYLYHSLEKELVWRDDQTLSGRLDRMESLLNSTTSIDVLRQQRRSRLALSPGQLPYPHSSTAFDTGGRQNPDRTQSDRPKPTVSFAYA